MDFTEIYPQSNSLVSFSPGAHFILTAFQDRLVVRQADTFQITRSWLLDASPSPTQALFTPAKPKAHTTTSDISITHAAWSCDSEYLLAANAKKGVVHVFKLRDEDWTARIDSGAEGLVRAEWAPDGRTILCFSEWGLRITVWSLLTSTATYIQYPVHPDRAYAFRSDGRYFALAERHKSKDTIGLYDTQDSYKLVRHFPVPTSSLASIALSPSGNHLAIWEGPLEYKVVIVTLAGTTVATFTSPTDTALGVRSVSWHPSGHFIAIAGWDDKIHILDSLTWSPAVTFQLSPRTPPDCILWKEPAGWLEATDGRGFLSYERMTGPQYIPITRADMAKPFPKAGAIQLDWNQTGTMLLARFESAPNVVHIYDFPPMKETGGTFSPKLRCVLVQARAVLSAKWNPVRKGSLILCTGSRSVYIWSDEWVGDTTVEGGDESEGGEDMAECVGVPAEQFETREVRWAPDGKGYILYDKAAFCCGFEVE